MQASTVKIISNASSETILYVSPSTIIVNIGDIFSVNVSVQDVFDVCSFYLYMEYNTTVLDTLNVYIYPPFDHGPSPIIDEPQGHIEIMGFSNIAVSGSFPIVKITFNATTSGDSLLHFYDSILYDLWFNHIAHTTDDGTVHVTMGEIHDIAVVDVTPPKTVVGQGYTMNISITVANQGDFTETFNITLYANTTAIETKEITVQNGASTTVTFTWNTTGFAKGNYTLWAYAWPVQDETNTEDNTYINGLISVTIPGDVDGDFKVTMTDIILLIKAFGSKIGQSKYNPNCDINNDGIINMDDIMIALKSFGKIYRPYYRVDKGEIYA
ncbi:MAG: dockerin type I domain-containing protein [Candidatus Bathyarchaeia archaeon]